MSNLVMREGLCSRRRDRDQERPLPYEFHLPGRRLDDYSAVPVLGLEFLPRRQPGRLSNCLWDYHSPGRIDGGSHAIILPFPLTHATGGRSRTRASAPLLLID